MNSLAHPVRLFAVGCALLAPLAAQSPDEVETARLLHAKGQNPTVRIGGVLQITMGMMGEQEQPLAATGLVLDATGLTLVPSASIDPMGGEEQTIEAGPGMEVTISSELTSLWLQLADGSRAEAQVVVSDPDLGFALVRPDKPLAGDAKLPACELPSEDKALGVLDQLIVLDRLDKDAGFAPSVHFARVHAVLDVPFRSYVVNATPGSVAYHTSGELLGMVAFLPSEQDDAGVGMMGMMAGGSTGGTLAIVPISALQALIAQGRGKKAEGKNAPSSDGGGEDDGGEDDGGKDDGGNDKK